MADQSTEFPPSSHAADGRPRARGLGLPMPGTPGPLNAITDVPGIAVGYTTLAEGTESVRTGVTAILPRASDDLLHPVWAGTFSMNGNGEMTGTHWIREAGWFTGPITITNTLSVGLAHHATARWMAERFPAAVGEDVWILPVAAETYDGYLNDIAGFHVTEAHVRTAIDGAQGGALAEGSVGGGTGMIAYEFKGGTGTASRRFSTGAGQYTLGALVQANHGLRPWLNVCGVPVGREMPGAPIWNAERGSIIVVLATDAPLLPNQLERLARRAAIGIGRGGTPSGNNSGDIFIAFTTANDPGPLPEPPRLSFEALGSDELDALFMAAVESVEEAVINAMLAADTMVGRRGRRVEALDHRRLMALFESSAG
ncbi:MAG: P1 family peptidase [Acidihalobacter sp.]|uniref:DmpA family aminopeptidase n=1 Tax=Acidihalobacter sp. TaxID=1872108 RepID=UPI00307D152E